MTPPSHNWQESLHEEKQTRPRPRNVDLKTHQVEVEPVSTSLSAFSKNLSSDLQRTTPMTTYDHVIRHLKKTAKTTLVEIFMSANNWNKITHKSGNFWMNQYVSSGWCLVRMLSKRLREETFWELYHKTKLRICIPL